MNKDLDERLVPNGEYRDAMNIQVSTSEGSDVGTVQNILGNSLVPGQNFIGNGALCVGSIADEKHDKLYYFVTENKELIQSGNFDFGTNKVVSGGVVTSASTAENWTLVYNTSAEEGWEWSGQKIKGTDVPSNYKINQYLTDTPSQSGGIPTGDFIKDVFYEVKFTVSGSNGDSITLTLSNEDGERFSISSGLMSDDGDYTFVRQLGSSPATTNSQFFNRLYIQATGGGGFTGNIDNISIKRVGDYIIEYDSKTNSVTPVIVDTNNSVLKFSSKMMITGINIIDDILLWTDNVNEPKKISISRCKQGTLTNGLTKTSLIVKDQELRDLKEEDITLIKKSPSKAPIINKTLFPEGSTTEGRIGVYGQSPATNLNVPLFDVDSEEGDEFWVGIGYLVGNRPELLVGDTIRLYLGTSPAVVDDEYVARLLITEVYPVNTELSIGGSVIAYDYQMAIKVHVSTKIDHNTSVGNYYFKAEKNVEGIFKRKFPRFAYRYKYQDGEYSPVGPFSEVVFVPGDFKYHPTKAYNEGMVNTLKELELKNFVTEDIPLDVVQIDLLYKNEFSPNVYLIKTLDKDSEYWNANGGHGAYGITTENIYTQIPSNQLIRPWDNVPRKALAQEVTGNRLVYANYTQGYNMYDDTNADITPNLTANLYPRELSHGGGNKALKSLKSQRTYNVGIVYGDKYGRETPVFTNDTANQLVTKSFSATSNALGIKVNSDYPSWADYYKIFIKETANEYYNLAMGRIYDAQDGNVWISFPSIDRNKVNEDTYLILKKEVGYNQEDGGAVTAGDTNPDARYKIVAISNEAPEYIKTEYTILAETNKKIHGATLFGGVQAGGLFSIGSPANGPTPGKRSFTIDSRWWQEDGLDNWQLGLTDLETIWNDRGQDDIYVSFSNRNLDLTTNASASNPFKFAPTVMSRKYKVIDISSEPSAGPATSEYNGHAFYKVNLAEVIPQNEAWLTEYLGAGADGAYNKGGRLRPHFYKKEVLNKPEFDGRFFVKIIEDEIITKALRTEDVKVDSGWEVTASIDNLYYLKDGTGVGETGQNSSTTKEQWEDIFAGMGSSGKWFIDEASYAGLQPLDDGHPKNSVHQILSNSNNITLSDTTENRFFLKFDIGSPVQLYYPSGGANGDPFYPNPVIDTELLAKGSGMSEGGAALRGIHQGRYETVEMGNIDVDAYVDDSTTATSTQTGGKFLSLSYSSIGPDNVNDYDSGSLANANEAAIYPKKGKPFWDAFQEEKNWFVGSDGGTNSFTNDQDNIVSNLKRGSLFRLAGDSNVYKIKGVTKKRIYNYMGAMYWDGVKKITYGVAHYHSSQYGSDGFENYTDTGTPPSYAYPGTPADLNENGLGYFYTNSSGVNTWFGYNNNANPKNVYNLLNDQNIAVYGDNIGSYTAVHAQHANMTAATNCRVNYLINYEVLSFAENPQIDNDSDERDLASNSVITDTNPPTATNSCRFEFLKEFSTVKENRLPKFPAVFETEPTEDVGLDIYYEASGKVPVKLNYTNISNFLQIGSSVGGGSGAFVTDITYVDPNSYNNVTAWRIGLSTPVDRNFFGSVGTEVNFYNEDGGFVIGNLLGVINPLGVDSTYAYSDDGGIVVIPGFDFIDPDDPTNSPLVIEVDSIIVTFTTNKIGLGWFNCWSFGNGVESNRIGDTYNKPFITNGVKVSTTLLDKYEEEHRKYGLIYSGIYNSTSGVNSLNQFIAGEKITKDINPSYGSIQKLHSRSTADGDLIALCEDRVLKILANKDALFNADGNPQLIANNSVLGQTIPFVGEYGISKNPESFASESYRVYFTDRVRGAVIRLSKDGLTPISSHGMKDWFKDNLSLGTTNLLGENNLSSQDNWSIPSNGNSAVVNGEAILGYYNNDINDSRYGGVARLRMNNILEIGKTYRLQYEVIEHSGLKNQNTGDYSAMAVVNTFPGSGWISGAYSGSQGATNGGRVNATWTANRTDFELLHYQVNSPSGLYTPLTGDPLHGVLFSLGSAAAGSGSIRDYVRYRRIQGGWPDTNNNGIPDNNDYPSTNWLYGGIVRIKNLIVTEVKEDSKLIGSYDDNKEEYNITIHSDQPATVSFKENTKGWVSFKSFIPEHAVSCANNYYTINNGKLWQHHNPGVNRNTFYNVFSDSSFDVLLNDMPSSVKSYHALDYEGSQSRVEGIKTLSVTGVQANGGFAFDGKYAFFEVSDMNALMGENISWSNKNHNIKQYRNNTLIFEGLIIGWANTSSNSLTSPSGGPTKGHFRKVSGSNPGDFKVGDIITTQAQEDSVNHFNSKPLDGWHVTSIETDKEKGSLLEFIEKEGKWFNYIKGVEKEINSDFDFGALEVQGLGVIKSSVEITENNVVVGVELDISGGVNSSLQVGDIIYHEQMSQNLEDNILDVNLFTSGYNQSYYNSIGNTNMGSDLGFVINTPTTVTWNGLNDVNVPSGVNYLNNVTLPLEVGATYFVKLVLTNYNGTGDLGLTTNGGLSSNMRLAGDGSVSEFFVSNGNRPDLFGRSTNSGDMNITIQKAVSGGILGFTRLEPSNLTKAGVVTSINSNTISIDLSGIIPLNSTYGMFVKNQVINMSGLSGYYATAKFKNNSKTKAELFSVSSEVSESSK